MNQKEVMEIKSRFTKDSCTFQRIRSVYVNSDKVKVTTADSPFLMLSEGEMFKYLDIAKKTLSGKAGDALLDIDMNTGDTEQKDLVKLLTAIKKDEAKDDALVEQLFDHIIDTYDSVDPYYIVLYYDVYDVPTKTSDNNKLDESEEVYEYLLCSICPVKMSKPGLGYLEAENKVGLRIRDWVVQTPAVGFLYPAFNERSTDINAALFYSKNTKEPDHTFMESFFGCTAEMTKTEKKERFTSILRNSLAESSDDAVTYAFHEKLNELAEERMEQDKEEEPLTAEDVKEVAEEAGIDEGKAKQIAKAYTLSFGNDKPTAGAVVDSKLLGQQLIKENAELKARIVDLMAENTELKEKLGKN